MSVGRCMHHALAIAVQPLDKWAPAIADLPDACTQDCGAPRSCRQRNADYLRVQYRVLKALESRAPSTSQGALL